MRSLLCLLVGDGDVAGRVHSDWQGRAFELLQGLLEELGEGREMRRRSHSPTPVPTTTGGVDSITQVSGSRSESDSRYRCTGGSWRPHGSSMTMAWYPKSPALTGSSPPH